MTYDAQEKSQWAGQPVECFKFTLGGTAYLYTSADIPITIGADTYQPEAIARSQEDHDQEDRSSSIKVALPRLNPISILFMPYTSVEPMSLVVTRMHYGDPETVVAFTGTVASAEFDGSICMLTCTRLSELIGRRIPAFYYQEQCNWALYSSRCGVNAASRKDSAVLSAVSGETIQSSTFAARADDWYENGWVQLATGEKRFIVKHVGNTLTLMSPFFGLVAGATVDAYAGCDRTEATCSSKFNNLVNHFGFKRVPQRNPHTSGIA